ncbi:MAG: hypothetical protein AAF217_07125 [Pseudomonadota bacterium]
MLSAFNLKTGTDFNDFKQDYAKFVSVVRDMELIVDAGPIGRRISDTPMDTAEAEHREYFHIMRFQDRAQLEKAYEHLLNNKETRNDKITHIRINRAVVDPTFICWQEDVD